MLRQVLLVVAALSPVAGALLARGTRRARLDPLAGVVGLLAAVIVLVAVARDGDVALGGWFVADRVGALWTVFVLTVALAVRSFARRQLAADPSRERFHVASAVVTTTAVALCTAADLWMLAGAAVATSVVSSALVGVRGGAVAARRMRRTLLVGDAFLLAAVAVVAVDAGGSSPSALASLGDSARHAVALLVVTAALVRCAQPPAHGWLPRTLVAPTPASALLHAGVVNAGGVLLVRFAPTVASSLPATLVGLALAATGVLLGLAAMRTRADVKGTLVWSTTAQMGFMLVQVLVGLGGAAALHLVAHGAYKSSLFLSSGSTIEHRPITPPPGRRVHHVVAAVGAIGLTALAVAVSGFHLTTANGAATLLPAFAVVTAFAVLAGPTGVRRGVGARAATTIGSLAVLLTAYLWGVEHLERWLQLPAAVPAGAAWLVGAFVLAVLAADMLAATHVTARPRVVATLHARTLAASRRPLLDHALAGGR